jgi:hypothetical protein
MSWGRSADRSSDSSEGWPPPRSKQRLYFGLPAALGGIAIPAVPAAPLLQILDNLLRDHEILQPFQHHANNPRTHQRLAQAVWQRDGSGEIEYLRIVVKQLRRKLEVDPEEPRYILTERSVGYRFQTPVPAEWKRANPAIV